MQGSATSSTKRFRVLCVDDEPQVLAGLSLHLRRAFEVVTASSPAQALVMLEEDPSVAVVLSDMRMPGMNGASFLHRSREVAPNAVRLLLTGHADVDSAVAAVNDGQIFRFLTKPCPPPTLISAVTAAAEHHRLITAEKVLLEQTLHGSIKALMDVLALTSPLSFGRANRIKRTVSAIAAHLGVEVRWQLELAALLSQLGCVTLPEELEEKLRVGHALSDKEQELVSKVPAVTEQLLGNIPRLEVVRAILAASARAGQPHDQADPLVDIGAQLLRAAIDFDVAEARAVPAQRILDAMWRRPDRYQVRVVEALAHVLGDANKGDIERELPLSALKEGMVIAQDVKLVNGALLVARGYEVTRSFVERVKNFRPGSVKEPLLVKIPGGSA